MSDHVIELQYVHIDVYIANFLLKTAFHGFKRFSQIPISLQRLQKYYLQHK